MLESRDNVKVAIRIRPLSSKELQETNASMCVSASSAQNSVVIDLKPEPRVFTYDFVADENATQEQVFTAVGTPVTTACLSGYNCTIFAYGQTGAGKTYTILGPDLGTSFDGPEQEFRGLLPRCAEFLFSSIARETRVGELEFLVKCSYLEIYQETIIDLLDPSGDARPLQLHEDIKRGVYVEGLIEESIGDVASAYELILRGNRNRHVGATSMNKESSRSHTVFTIVLESKDTRTEALNFRSSLFHLIDLAGSERQKATDAAGERLKEAGKINKSLSALGNVINSLVDIAEGKNRHVHYRDSKLTFLLKDSLGGNAKTLIVANISPAATSFGETLSTLKFVQRAKLIRNKAVINEDTSGTMEVLKEELRRVKEQLSQATIDCPKCGGMGNEEKCSELERLLDRNMRLRQSTEALLQSELSKRDQRIIELGSAISKYEQSLHDAKSLIKLQEARQPTHTANEEIAKLERENALLRGILDSNPQMETLACENEELREKIREVKDKSVSILVKENQDFAQELAETLSDIVQERDDLKSLIVRQQRDLKSEEAIGELKAMYEERIMTLSEQLAEEVALNESLVRKTELQAKRIESLSAKLAAGDVPFSPMITETSFDLTDAFMPPRKSLLTPLTPIVESHMVDTGKVSALEIRDLTDALETKDAELREIREELEVMATAAEYIKLQVAESNQRAEAKTAENSELLRELKEVKAAAKAQAELLKNSKEGAVRMALAENESLRRGKAEAEKSLSAQEGEVRTLRERLRDLEQQLDTASAQERLSANAIVDLQKRLQSLTQALFEKTEALEATEAELQFYQQGNKELSAASAEQFQREKENLRRQYEEEITEIRRREQEYEEKLQGVMDKDSATSSAIEALKSQLAAARNNLAQAQAVNKVLTDTVGELRCELASSYRPAVDPQALAEELQYLRTENHTLKEEVRTKAEILSNTNRNILATRSEIEQWKKSIESKNSTIRALKGELKDKEATLAVVQKACAEKLTSLSETLSSKDAELRSVKEVAAKRIKQAEVLLEKQRKDVEFIASQSKLLRPDVEHPSASLCGKDAQIAQPDHRETGRRSGMTSPRPSRSPSDKRRDEQRYLSEGLTKISEFVRSLPISRDDPEETDIVEGTIRGIARLYATLETRELELSDKERELQHKHAKLQLLETEKALCRQRTGLRP